MDTTTILTRKRPREDASDASDSEASEAPGEGARPHERSWALRGAARAGGVIRVRYCGSVTRCAAVAV